MRRAAFLLLALALLRCGPEIETATPAAPKQETAETPAPEMDIDADNLVNVAYGASIVSRTAEEFLERSAVQAIDGISTSFWSAPRGSTNETIVISLAAPARIERLGITSSDEAPPKCLFEASSDGRSWRSVSEQKLVKQTTPQIIDVEPFVARYLRVNLEITGGVATLNSIHAIGRETERPSPRRFDGCWTINGRPARISQDGARVTGVITTEPPTFLDGGTDGRVAQLMWKRGANWGHAALTAAPDGRTLSGLVFFEEIATTYIGPAWFGTRCSKSPPTVGDLDPASFLQRVGRWSMYGLTFDAQENILRDPSSKTLDTLVALIKQKPSGRYRIVAHEMRRTTPEESKQRTDARLAALRAELQRRGLDSTRLEFISAGSVWSEPPISAAIQRLLASRVDLEEKR